MKDLIIEWKHYDKEGVTCERCGATGANLHKAIEDLHDGLATRGIAVKLRETLLPEGEIAQSNLLLFNGIRLEDLLEEASGDETFCGSCTCLTGNDTTCRAVTVGGTTYEDIPEELIRTAMLRAAERAQPE